MVTLTGVSVTHPAAEIAVLSEFMLQVERGELVILFGPGGCGKSTVLQLLTAEVSTTSGAVSVMGRDPRTLSGSALAKYRQSLGVMFQDLKLLEDRSAAENILLPLEIAGVRSERRRARLEDVLTQLGLSQRADLLPKQLSMSDRQKVAFGRAIAAEPLLLLADDPTALLDDAHARELAELLNREHLRGMTIVLATNDDRLLRLLPSARVVAMAAKSEALA